MNLNKYITFTILLFLLCITSTYAACTQEELNDFKKIEQDYKVTYEFDKNTKDYRVTFYIPYIEKYVYEIDQNINLENAVASTGKSFTVSGIKTGDYRIEVVGTTVACNDTLKEIILKLPKYNVYSEDPLCAGIEEFVLCQPTYDKDIDYDTFVSRVNTYKKSKTEKLDEKPKEEPQENVIIEYIKDNLIQIIIITIFIILVTITIIVTAKSIRKSRRLE